MKSNFECIRFLKPIEASPNFKLCERVIFDVVHHGQSSFWVYPVSGIYKNFPRKFNAWNSSKEVSHVGALCMKYFKNTAFQDFGGVLTTYFHLVEHFQQFECVILRSYQLTNFGTFLNQIRWADARLVTMEMAILCTWNLCFWLANPIYDAGTCRFFKARPN